MVFGFVSVPLALDMLLLLLLSLLVPFRLTAVRLDSPDGREKELFLGLAPVLELVLLSRWDSACAEVDAAPGGERDI